MIRIFEHANIRFYRQGKLVKVGTPIHLIKRIFLNICESSHWLTSKANLLLSVESHKIDETHWLKFMIWKEEDEFN